MLVTFAIAAALTAPIEVIYHADLEGRMAVPNCGEPGPAEAPDYAAQVGVIAQLRTAATTRGIGDPVVLLGGDQIAPDLFVRGILKRDRETGARDVAAALAVAKYDALAIGNHELGMERDRLEAFIAAAAALGMPSVLSNIKCDAAAQSLCKLIKADVMIERGAQKIGVLAVLSQRTFTAIAKEKREGVELTDMAAAITAGAARLRAAGATIVVVMVQSTSNRSAVDEVLALQLAMSKNGPDVILSAGLSDVEAQHPMLMVRQASSPPVIGSTSGAAGVTRVTLEPRDGATWIDAVAVPSVAAQRDPTVDQILAPHIRNYCDRYALPVGGPDAKPPATREALLAFTLNVMRKTTGSEIAIINNGFVNSRAFPMSGRLTRAKLKRALPYSTVVGTVMVPGANLAGILEAGEASKRLAMLGAARPGPGKAFEVNGRPIDKARDYRVAVIDFIAKGGDGIYEGDQMKKWKPSPGITDLRENVEVELGKGTDFGPPASERVLIVAIGDLAADLTNTSIRNNNGLEDAQLTRAEQRAIKVELSGLLLLDHPLHRSETKLVVKYGYARTQPLGMDAAGQETLDVIQLTSLYSFRGLKKGREDQQAIPDPYSRLGFETELTVPDERAYRHAELTHTAGALWTLLKSKKLKLRAGAGYRTELFADSDSMDPIENELGGFRFIAEAGAALDPVVLATRGPLQITFESTVDYFMVDPIDETEHQIRGSGKLSLPLLPLLFLQAGLDVFAVHREGVGWGTSLDTTIGLKVHVDAAYQAL